MDHDIHHLKIVPKQKLKRKLSPEESTNQVQQELLNRLTQVDDDLKYTLADECEDTLYTRSLIPILKGMPLKKKRLAKIKISQLLYDMEFED